MIVMIALYVWFRIFKVYGQKFLTRLETIGCGSTKLATVSIRT